MHFRLALVTVAAVVFAIAGCDSSKTASSSNFKKLINDAMAKDCVVVGPGMNLNSPGPYPHYVTLATPGFLMNAESVKIENDRMTGPYEALVKAGLLTGRDGDVPAYVGAKNTVKGRIYDLTSEGKKYLIDPKTTGFCAAHYSVDAVTQFTQPGNAMGVTVSMAQFSYSAVDVAPWAKDPALLKVFTGLDKQLASGQKGSAEMDLMNTGWKAHPQRAMLF